MFRRGRNLLETIRDNLETAIGNLFGRGERGNDVPVEPVNEPVVDHDDEDIEDTDLEFEEFEDVEDTDDYADEYDEIYEDSDDWERYDVAAQEFKTLQDYLGDPEALRVVRYATSEEAQAFLEEAGIDAFSEILYDEDTDTFTIAVYDSPGAT